MSGGVAQLRVEQVPAGLTRGTVQSQNEALHVGMGPRPATRSDPVTETLGEIWIWNGTWEPMAFLKMRSTACWAVTFVAGSIFARLVRLEM